MEALLQVPVPEGVSTVYLVLQRAGVGPWYFQEMANIVHICSDLVLRCDRTLVRTVVITRETIRATLEEAYFRLCNAYVGREVEPGHKEKWKASWLWYVLREIVIARGHPFPMDDVAPMERFCVRSVITMLPVVLQDLPFLNESKLYKTVRHMCDSVLFMNNGVTTRKSCNNPERPRIVATKRVRDDNDDSDK
eukprot:PhF_6_TR26997/c0_g1_i3/m.39409